MSKHIAVFEINVETATPDYGNIVISTANYDRNNNRVIVDGMQADAYLKNPVVVWGHNYTDPWALIGNAVSLTKETNGIRSEFNLRKGVTEQDPQHIIRALWADRLVKAASIGMIPNATEATKNTEGGYDFNTWELLEYSLVMLPMNRQSLRLAFDAFTHGDVGNKSPELVAGHLVDAIKNGVACERTFDTVMTQACFSTPGEKNSFVQTPPIEEYPSIIQYTTTGSTDSSLYSLRDGVWFDVTESGEDDEVIELDAPEQDVKTISLTVRKFAYGPQEVLAVFNSKEFDVPEDATKMFIEPNGAIEEMVHPFAGEVVTYDYVTFIPPVKLDNLGRTHQLSVKADLDMEMGLRHEKVISASVTGGTLSESILEIELENSTGKEEMTVAMFSLCRITEFDFIKGYRQVMKTQVYKSQLEFEKLAVERLTSELVELKNRKVMSVNELEELRATIDNLIGESVEVKLDVPSNKALLRGMLTVLDSGNQI